MKDKILIIVVWLLILLSLSAGLIELYIRLHFIWKYW